MGRQPSYGVREKILAAALQVFGDKGYKEATVREIARIAGVAVGGLYPYFGNKEQLYVEVLLEGMKLYNERVRRFENANPQVAIRRYIENHLDYLASRKEIVSRHFKDYDLEFAKPIRSQFFAHQKEFLEGIIRNGAEQGIFPIVDCGEAALFVLCLLKGALFYDLAGAIELTQSGNALSRLVVGFLRSGETPGEAHGAHPAWGEG